MSPDGHTLVSGSADGTTRLWGADTRHTPPELEGFELAAGFTSRGRQLVAASDNRWCVWTPESGARVDLPFPSTPPLATVLPGFPAQPYDVKPDEPLGALGRLDGSIELWHLTTGARMSAWPAHGEGIAAVAFSPDGKRLATGSLKGELKTWDLATQREVARLGPLGFNLFCLRFSPDGRTLAASGESSSVWLWDTSTRNPVRQLSGHLILAASVAFSPDGTLLAAPSMSGDVLLWGLPSGRKPVTLKGHVSMATAVAFSPPDGKTLATGGMDKKVKLWNIAAEQELVTLPVAVDFPALTFSPDGQLLAVGDRTRDHPAIQILRAPSFEDIAETESKDHPAPTPAP
jgi:WD40 repeat protein